MTFEITDSTKDERAVELAHDQLATEHGRENVFVVEGQGTEVVALIGEDMGHIDPESVEVYQPIKARIPDHGHRIIKEEQNVNFREILKRVGDSLVFQTDKLVTGFRSETVFKCTGCPKQFDDRKSALGHIKDVESGDEIDERTTEGMN